MFTTLIKTLGTNVLFFTIPISLALHLFAWKGVAIGIPDVAPAPRAPVFDITMVNFQDSKAPDKADFIANANQQGSGSKEEKSRITSPFAADEPNVDNGDDFFTAEKQVEVVKPKLTPQLLTTKGKTKKRVDKKPEEQEQEIPVKSQRENSEQTEAIAKLMAEMSQQEERYAKRPRIHFIDSLSARGSIEAEYIHNWSKKLERIGNINFPAKALELSLSGTLILNATLDRAGRVVEIQITTSSGSKVLDNGAIKIVKLAAPYDPLPTKIRAKYDRLNITRTIVFHKAEGDSEAKFYSK